MLLLKNNMAVEFMVGFGDAAANFTPSMEENAAVSAVQEAASAGIQSVHTFLTLVSHTPNRHHSQHDSSTSTALDAAAGYEAVADSVVNKFKKVISLLDRNRTGHARFRRAPVDSTASSPPKVKPQHQDPSSSSPISVPQLKKQESVSAFKVYCPTPYSVVRLPGLPNNNFHQPSNPPNTFQPQQNNSSGGLKNGSVNRKDSTSAINFAASPSISAANSYISSLTGDTESLNPSLSSGFQFTNMSQVSSAGKPPLSSSSLKRKCNSMDDSARKCGSSSGRCHCLIPKRLQHPLFFLPTLYIYNKLVYESWSDLVTSYKILNELQRKQFIGQINMSKIPPSVLLFLFGNLLSSFVVHAIVNVTGNKTQYFKVGSDRNSGKECDRGWPHCKQPITAQRSSLLPVEAEVLIFEDLRLSVVYPDNKSATAVASIDFNGFQLSAPSLEGFLDQLPDIAVFHANSNKFAGTISTNIAKLPYLYELDVSNNRLSGPFPTAVVGLNSLTFLDLRFNFFTGSVPPRLFVQDLDFLLINNNNLMQNLPDSLSSTHILYLTLANNKLSGSIPVGIVEALSTLTEVLLVNNSLSGCLPYELGSLDEAVVFDAGNNRLTGPLPFSLACLKKVEQLNFAGNLLYGMVPEMVCALRNLINLSLSDNYFTVVGPLCRILIGRGVLNIRNNCIPDLPFQRPIVECAKFLAFPRVCPRMWTYTLMPCMFTSINPPITSIPKYQPHFP